MSHVRIVNDCAPGSNGTVVVNRTKVSDLSELLIAVYLARGEKVSKSEATRRALAAMIESLGGTLPASTTP